MMDNESKNLPSYSEVGIQQELMKIYEGNQPLKPENPKPPTHGSSATASSANEEKEK